MMRIAAVFDVDGTLVRANAVQYYLYFVKHRYRLFKKWAILSSMALRVPYWWTLDQINRAWFNRSFYLNFHGLSVEEGHRLAHDCFQEFMRKRLISEAVKKLGEHQREGHRILLLSGSLDFILNPLAQHLCVETVLAPSLIQAKGRYQGRLKGAPLIGENKAKVLKDFAEEHEIDLSASFAYADSKSDLPLLESVGHPVVVNPKGKMKRIAQNRGWVILPKASPLTAPLPDLLVNSSKPKLQNLGGLR